MSERRFTGRQLTTVVVSLCAAAVLTPVGVLAATGSPVTLVDPIFADHKARVGGSGGLWTVPVDAVSKAPVKIDAGKMRVGDGSGNLTVDGIVGAVPQKPTTPFTKQISATWSEASGHPSSRTTFLVPAGKTLVVESVAVTYNLPQGQTTDIQVIVDENTVNQVFYPVSYAKQASFAGSFDTFSGTHAVRWYIPAGSLVAIRAFRNGNTGTGAAYATISGFLA